MSMRTIENFEQFKSALRGVGKRSKAQVADLVRCVAWAYSQGIEHHNSHPLALLRATLPDIACKPSGCSQKNLDVFVETYVGFGWDKATKAYKMIKGANVLDLPEQGVAFWDHSRDNEAAFSLHERLGALIRRAKKEKYSDEQIIAVFTEVAADLSDSAELLAAVERAKALGIA